MEGELRTTTTTTDGLMNGVNNTNSDNPSNAFLSSTI